MSEVYKVGKIFTLCTTIILIFLHAKAFRRQVKTNVYIRRINSQEFIKLVRYGHFAQHSFLFSACLNI